MGDGLSRYCRTEGDFARVMVEATTATMMTDDDDHAGAGDGVQRTQCCRGDWRLSSSLSTEVVRWRVELPLLASNPVQCCYGAILGKNAPERTGF